MSVGYSRRGDAGAAGNEGPHRPDWLNSRLSSKAFRAAALLDREQRDAEARDHTADVTERARMHHRERSGSFTRQYNSLSPSPLSGGGLVHHDRGLGRLGSLRGTASEYNPSHHGPRSHSRMAQSDAGDLGGIHLNRAGSGGYSASHGGESGGGGGGLMESPTFTTSSGSRDRASTAATSVSGYGSARDRRDSRERFADELRDLRDKHSTEMAALLGALSDSQRTGRILREENTRLRDRIDRAGYLEAENDELGHVCSELRLECTQLRRENEQLRRELESKARWEDEEPLTPQWASFATRTPTKRHPVSRVDGGHEHGRGQDHRNRHNMLPSINTSANESLVSTENMEEDFQFSSKPPRVRRLSTSSSIFPIPPSNMSMLVDGTAQSFDHRIVSDRSQFPDAGNGTLCNNVSPQCSPRRRPTSIPTRMQSPPRTQRGNAAPGHDYRRTSQNMSISSAHNISPTTANFSIMTGSPGSLFLKPEHEIMLGEMESLELGGIVLDESERTQGSGW